MEKDLELYIHIPFCVRKCLYCDFLSYPAGRDEQDAYMQALLMEVTGWALRCSGYRVISVFIGGGTPSVVASAWIERVMACIRERYLVSEDVEVTMELNPGTVTRQALEAYRRAGVNRLSIGLQSAVDEELGTLGRIHTWEDFQRTFCLARAAGFDNINVDVMSALPGQSVEAYRYTLREVCALQMPPQHISAYSLIVEEGTPFARMAAEGKLPLPDEDTDRLMYEETERILGEAGYTRYEISNYAKEGYACRHNIGYWKRTDYLGFGLGAASCLDNVRFRNTAKPEEYLRAPMDCHIEREALTEKEQMEEFCFLGLRMTEGIAAKDFCQSFGMTLEEVYGEVIRRNVKDGLLTWSACGERLALTRRGLSLSNYVSAQFLLDEE